MKTSEMKVHLINSPLSARKVLFTAIRTAYSAKTPFEIYIGNDFEEYDNKEARDGKGGTEVDRLFRHIVGLNHHSVLEHLNFTFLISGVSRSLLAQLTRHRVGVSPTVQSQRYVDDGSGKMKGGMEAVVPHTIEENPEAREIFENLHFNVQMAYDALRDAGIPKEDARFVLPNSASTNMTLTMNLRAILHFYSVRNGKGAQWEIKEFAQKIKDVLIYDQPWLKNLFDLVEFVE